MEYVVFTIIEKNGCIDEYVKLRTTDFKKAVTRWDDERYYIMRDNKKDCECHIAVNDDFESGNYDYLDDGLKWYAVMQNNEDNDWGYGSFFLDVAQEMLKDYPNGYIAVIQNDTCIEEIHP